MKYVYVMKSGDGQYKVGIATSVTRRMRAIQTSNPNRVSLICCRLIVDAERVEREIHQTLASKKMDGGQEWFKLQPDEVLTICEVINAAPGAAAAEGLIVLPDMLAGVQQTTEEWSKQLRQMSKDVAALQKDGQLATVDDEDRAMTIFTQRGRVSVSLLQRELRIGYAKAARIIDSLHNQGLVSEGDGVHARRLLV
jgi:DNA segregation ATPase FtsK/SpoIIIE-like protein